MFKHWKRSDPPMDESNGNISSLSDHDPYCCERKSIQVKNVSPTLRNGYFLLVLSSFAKNILKDLSHNYDACQQRIQLSSSLARKRFFAASEVGFLSWENIKAKGGIEIFEINVENFSHIPDLWRGFAFLLYFPRFETIDNFLFIFLSLLRLLVKAASSLLWL